MTTEERIAVMEECAKLVEYHSTPYRGVGAIRAEIARLRREMEPPTAEEWRDCVDYVLTHGTDSEHNLRALLQRADRAKRAK